MALRRRPWGGVFAGLLLATGGLMAGSLRGTAASRIVPGRRAIMLRYTARLRQLPADAQAIHLWIPLAKTSAEQEVLQRRILAPVPYTVEREGVYGNDILHLILSQPVADEVSVSIEYQAVLRGGGAAPSDDPQLSPAQWQRYQAPEGLVIIDEEVQARARLAVADRSTVAERARGIYDHVIQRMAYDKDVPGWGRGDTRRACRLGKGNCTDFHSLFISMARAARIPARFKIGVLVPSEPSGTIPGYHCWAEFYEPERGWVSVDASEAWKQPELADHYFGSWDANRFLISVGRDLRLVPTQQGDPLNIFFYPYVEVDGKAFAGVETEIRFTDLQPGGAI